jgi:hypothetical protein
MTNSTLKFEINSLPLEMRAEVADFIAFLKNKVKKENNIKEREFGFAKGKISISDDFDAPLDDFNDYI